MRNLPSFVILAIGSTVTGGAIYFSKLDQLTHVAQEKTPSSTGLEQSASKFLATLNGDSLAKAVLAYDAPERTKWAFIPLPTRKGLPLREMNDSQKEAAFALMKDVLSSAGYTKATSIMNLELLLRQLEGPGKDEWRDPYKYYFTIYGQPASNETWGLSIEGHHVSLNFVIKDSKIVESTPQFFATNPATLQADYSEQFKKGMRILKNEEQLAYDLLHSLDEKQLKQAVIADESPAEIRFTDKPHAEFSDPKGIPSASLTAQQKDTLKSLMTAYTSSMLDDVASARWKAIEEAGFDKIHFAWAGGKEPGVGHYYVVQGPTFMIEFVNTQADAAGNPANHIHCVWRDGDGDFYLPRQ